VKRSTKAFWQGVLASIVATVLLEGIRHLTLRADDIAEGAEGAVDAAAPTEALRFLENMDPPVRLALVGAVGFALGMLVFVGMQRVGIKIAAVVVPVLAVAAIVGVYLWLVF